MQHDSRRSMPVSIDKTLQYLTAGSIVIARNRGEFIFAEGARPGGGGLDFFHRAVTKTLLGRKFDLGERKESERNNMELA